MLFPSLLLWPLLSWPFYCSSFILWPLICRPLLSWPFSCSSFILWPVPFPSTTAWLRLWWEILPPKTARLLRIPLPLLFLWLATLEWRNIRHSYSESSLLFSLYSYLIADLLPSSFTPKFSKSFNSPLVTHSFFHWSPHAKFFIVPHTHCDLFVVYIRFVYAVYIYQLWEEQNWKRFKSLKSLKCVVFWETIVDGKKSFFLV